MGRLNNRGMKYGQLGLNVVHLRWKLKRLLAVVSARCSEETLTICLGLPIGPTSSLTIGANVAPSNDQFTGVSKICGRKSDDNTTKSIIELWPRVSWWQVHIWAPLCSHMVFLMDHPWWAHKSSNRTPIGFWSLGGLVLVAFLSNTRERLIPPA